MWFKSDKKEVIAKLLAQASADFRFDKNAIKYRLLSSIKQSDQKPVAGFKFNRVIKFGALTAGFVIFLSGAFAMASNSEPGDKLFILNKAGEKVILSLPISDQQKAQVQAYIVTDRLETLDQVEVETKQNTKAETKKLESIKESEETLTTAIDNISEKKIELESKGQTKSAEKLEDVLDQLQTKAEKREAKIKEIEEKTENSQTKDEIRKHRKKIEESRKKARAQIKKYKNQDREAD
jgi:hypothetical protein